MEHLTAPQPAADGGDQDPASPAPSAPSEGPDPVAAAPTSESEPAGEVGVPLRHAGLRYLALRTLLLLAVAGVLYLLGMRGMLLVILAFLVSGAISLFALSRTRIAASGSLDSRLQGWNRRFKDRAAAEDQD